MRSFLTIVLVSLITMSLDAKTLVYLGTYASGADAGIHVSTFDPGSGELGPANRVAEMDQAGFVAISPRGDRLYAVGERARGVVRAFALDRGTGELETINERSSGGPGPCWVSLDHTGAHLFTANYSGASVATIRIQDDGSLGEQTARESYDAGSGVYPGRQDKSFAHSANLDPSGRFLVVADLGADRLMIHRFDPESGALRPNDPAFVSVEPGSGPRHFAFHPNGRTGYILNELSNTVTVFDWDAAAGRLSPQQTIATLPSDFTAKNTSAEVVVHPNGRFLYTSNRGHNSIAIFSLDHTSGELAVIGHEPSGGETPRNFALAPGGAWMLVANQDSNNVVVFAVDPKTGALHRTASEISVPTPTCVRFLVVE